MRTAAPGSRPRAHSNRRAGIHTVSPSCATDAVSKHKRTRSSSDPPVKSDSTWSGGAGDRSETDRSSLGALHDGGFRSFTAATPTGAESRAGKHGEKSRSTTSLRAPFRDSIFGRRPSKATATAMAMATSSSDARYGSVVSRRYSGRLSADGGGGGGGGGQPRGQGQGRGRSAAQALFGVAAGGDTNASANASIGANATQGLASQTLAARFFDHAKKVE